MREGRRRPGPFRELVKVYREAARFAHEETADAVPVMIKHVLKYERLFEIEEERIDSTREGSFLQMLSGVELVFRWIPIELRILIDTYLFKNASYQDVLRRAGDNWSNMRSGMYDHEKA